MKSTRVWIVLKELSNKQWHIVVRVKKYWFQPFWSLQYEAIRTYQEDAIQDALDILKIMEK